MKFKNQHILITAGPTQEAIDPVRFISNHSSGKMGFELAKAFAGEGAQVSLIAGPNSLEKPDNNKINVIDVVSAEDMYEVTKELFPQCNIGIFAAAVADYTPKVKASQKIKKQTDNFSIEMIKTKDILKEAGNWKTKNQFTIGFALETQNAIDNAKGKLERKNCDMVVLNTLEDEKAGFGHNTNKVTLLYKNGQIQPLELKSKQEVAEDICQYLFKFIQ